MASLDKYGHMTFNGRIQTKLIHSSMKPHTFQTPVITQFNVTKFNFLLNLKIFPQYFPLIWTLWI